MHDTGGSVSCESMSRAGEDGAEKDAPGSETCDTCEAMSVAGEDARPPASGEGEDSPERVLTRARSGEGENAPGVGEHAHAHAGEDANTPGRRTHTGGGDGVEAHTDRRTRMGGGAAVQGGESASCLPPSLSCEGMSEEEEEISGEEENAVWGVLPLRHPSPDPSPEHGSRAHVGGGGANGEPPNAATPVGWAHWADESVRGEDEEEENAPGISGRTRAEGGGVGFAGNADTLEGGTHMVDESVGGEDGEAAHAPRGEGCVGGSAPAQGALNPAPCIIAPKIYTLHT